MTPTPANQTKAEKVNSSTAVTSKTTKEPLDHHQSTEEENRNEGDGSKTTKNQNLRAEVRPFKLATDFEPSDSHLNTFPDELRQRVLKWMPSSAQLMTIKLVCRSLYDSAKALEDAFFEEVTSLRFDLPYRAIRDGCVDAGSDDHHQQQHHFLDVADGEFFHPNDGPTVGSCLGVGGGNTSFRVHRGLLVKLAAGDDGQQCEALGRRPQPSLNTFEPRARDRYSKSAVLLRRRGRSRLESRIPDLFQDSDYQQQQQLTTTKVVAASEPAYDVVHQVANLQLAIQSVEHLSYHRQPSAAFIAACRRMANVRQLTLVNAAPLFGGMAAADQPGRQPFPRPSVAGPERAAAGGAADGAFAKQPYIPSHHSASLPPAPPAHLLHDAAAEPAVERHSPVRLLPTGGAECAREAATGSSRRKCSVD